MTVSEAGQGSTYTIPFVQGVFELLQRGKALVQVVSVEGGGLDVLLHPCANRLVETRCMSAAVLVG